MPEDKSAADLLADAGRALYGDKWLMRLARDLGISDDTLSRWMNGRVELKINHGAMRDASQLLRAKASTLLSAARAIEAAFREDLGVN